MQREGYRRSLSFFLYYCLYNSLSPNVREMGLVSLHGFRVEKNIMATKRMQMVESLGKNNKVLIPGRAYSLLPSTRLFQ